MTPKQAKAEADELIARANRIAKAKLDAAGEKRVKAKENSLRPKYLEKLREIERDAATRSTELDAEIQEYMES